MVGVGAVRTKHVLELVEDAQAAGAAALLLAPVSYQPPHADEVFDLYAEVDRHVSMPLCV
jgi:4-hydroxy-tetrahydrodipicolinate synthase